MTLSAIFEGLGRDRFDDLLSSVSMGALRTFKIFETFKIRARLKNLSRQKLRAAAPKLWGRLAEEDEELAREIAQGVLVSNLGMVIAALDTLGIPHDGNGFFDKDADAEGKLTEGWRQRLFDELKNDWPESVVLLYINHLDWELAEPDTVFVA